MARYDRTAAETYLAALKARGVDYIFANAGTDFAPLLEAEMNAPASGLAFPEFVIAPHENLAVAMAQGYYLATGRAQAAMVHVNVGVANALCGIMNAARDNIPLLLASGRTPVTEEGRVGSRDNFIHWGQEMFDQGAVLRELVKWDYELRYPEQTEMLVDRALAIAASEPGGPVYLSLPRETLAERSGSRPLADGAQIQPASPPAPDADAMVQAAHLLARARRPLIITSRAGKHAEAVRLLDAIAQDFAIPVVEFAANYMCLRYDHPMHAGFSPAPLLAEADVVLVLDAPVPWPPSRIKPKRGARIIQMGPDPLFERLPVRGFHSDLTIRAHAVSGLEALHAGLKRAASRRSKTIEARREELAPRLAQMRERRLHDAAAPGRSISHAYASHCIGQALGETGILVNERGCLREALRLTRPGSFFGPTIAGGLGASIGTALGIKLALPDRTVAAALGDGSAIFNNPVACLQAAAARKLPILVAVLNNNAWRSVMTSTVSVYPEGLTAKSDRPPLTRLDPSPDFAAIAQACGVRGLRVETPDELAGTLKEALDIMQRDQVAVLVDIRIGHDV